MKYLKLSIIAFAVAALMTACGQKDNANTKAPAGQEAQKAAPVVSVVTAQAEDVDITNRQAFQQIAWHALDHFRNSCEQGISNAPDGSESGTGRSNCGEGLKRREPVNLVMRCLFDHHESSYWKLLVAIARGLSAPGASIDSDLAIYDSHNRMVIIQ